MIEYNDAEQDDQIAPEDDAPDGIVEVHPATATAPSGKTFFQHVGDGAARMLRLGSKSPAGTGQPVGGRATERGNASERLPVAGAITCPDCKKAVSDVPELKRHMTDAHGGWSEQDVAAATAPESTVTVKRETIHRALKAHDALAKEVAAQNVGAPAAKGK